VPPDFSDLADQITLTPYQAVGIPLAIIGAIFLSLGAQFQHRGVVLVEKKHGTGSTSGLSMRQLQALLAQPVWVIGTLFLGLAIVFQLTSLAFAPLIVVQPLGAIALVMTAIMNSRISKIPLGKVAVRAILMCVGGIALFVTIAAFVAKSRPISQTQLFIVLGLVAFVILVLATIFVIFRGRLAPIFYIVGAGVLFGFVATLAKVFIDRIKTLSLINFEFSPVEWITALCLLALVTAALLGTYFVQTAYASGPPDLVVAGLTVIDPLVAVSIGIVVLGEAADAPLWAIIGFIIAGAIAIFGVVSLSKNHPQVRPDDKLPGEQIIDQIGTTSQ
jgi:drug/metabolite transporter (DMT)-like permease